MSSAVYLTPERPIPFSEWDEFCYNNSIQYSPQTVGQNVFYRGGLGGVEIAFGRNGKLPLYGDGRPDFAHATPPKEAYTVVVSTFHMGDLRSVAETAKLILARWPCDYEADTEFTHYLEELNERQCA